LALTIFLLFSSNWMLPTKLLWVLSCRAISSHKTYTCSLWNIASLKHVEVILTLSHSKLQLHLFIVHKKYRSIICLLPYTCESVFIMHMCIVVKFFC
jgi:hypothetical protein